jgi:outer membrane protein TolC
VAEADLALTSLSLAEERLDAARGAEAAAQAAARGARAAYEAGITSLPDRLRADQLLIDAQISRIEAETARATAAVSVYRAFGGGPPETAPSR